MTLDKKMLLPLMKPSGQTIGNGDKKTVGQNKKIEVIVGQGVQC